MSARGRSRQAGILASALVSAGLIWTFTIPTGAQPRPARNIAYSNFDVRTHKAEPASDAIHRTRARDSSEKRALLDDRRAARLRALDDLQRRTPKLRIVVGPLSVPEVIGAVRPGERLASGQGQPRETTLRNFLDTRAVVYGLSRRQLAQLRKQSEHVNPSGGMSWIVLEQRLRDRRVFRGELRAAFGADGDLVQTSGQLAPDVEDEDVAVEPEIDAESAVVIAASHIGRIVQRGDMRESARDALGDTRSFEGGPFARDTQVELIYFPLAPGAAHLAWSMVLWLDQDAYYVIVDAENGELLFRKNIVSAQTQRARYVVYADDSPAPMSPSPATPLNGAQGLPIARTAFSLIGEHPLNDPWLPDGAATTTGNNVDAGLDVTMPDGIDPDGRPVSPTRDFDFAYNPAPGLPAPGESPHGNGYRAGEVVNMFFWTNRFHDRLYELGFTEAAGNFQRNNYGRGGLGGDPVLAEAQDFSGVSNATFATPPDGSPGRMQMHIFSGPEVDRSSALDQEVLIHELTHGVSSRLHANASGLTTVMAAGMGEGWSDFYARALLSSADEDIYGIYPQAAYSGFDITAPTPYPSNYYYGIRRFPYALKATVGANGRPHNPLTLADVDVAQIDLTDGAFPRGPIGSTSAHAIHNIGELWCMALLEVRARFIERMGFAAGNGRMLQLVTDAMKLDPADPTLLDGRTSLLAASAASAGADSEAEERDIWAGFAARGMGVRATIAGRGPYVVSESFDVPNLTFESATIVADSFDGGGHADPGETITLAVVLRNPLASTPALDVSVSLQGGAVVPFGDIPADTAVARHLTFVVPSSQPCGSQLPLTIAIDSSLGRTSGSFVLQVGTPAELVPLETAGSGDLALAIRDLATVEIPIAVAGQGAIGDVNVRVRLDHTFMGDVELRLVAPDGTSVLLMDNRGGSGDNLGAGSNACSGTSAVFDDDAPVPIGSGTAPFAGSFAPETPLATLYGRPMAGTWVLRVTDTANRDTGIVGCVQLEISEQRFACAESRCSEPPVITGGTASPGLLWPPDGRMHTVALDYAIEDSCAGPVTSRLSVSSDEDAVGDWEVVDDRTVRLRAKRSGPTNGRVYTVVITATDAAGNTSSRTVPVTVPHDNRYP